VGTQGDTGWQTTSFILSDNLAAGPLSLSFAAVNVLDYVLDSRLLVDNVRAAEGPPVSVPEPAPLVLLAGGLLMLARSSTLARRQ
jgi:hypothetical protein